jgi:hypothetical protein
MQSSAILVIKSRGMRWAGRVARVGERRGIYGDLVWKSEGERDHLKDLDGNGRVIKIHFNVDLNPYPANVENMVSS